MKSKPAIRRLGWGALVLAAAGALTPVPDRAQIWNRIQKHVQKADQLHQELGPMTIAQE